jgi:recombination protein RecT
MMSKELQPWQSAIQKAKTKFQEINMVNNLVNYDKEAMFAMQAITNNNYLMKIANDAPSSLRDAVINIAAIGLSLNPAEKLAYLVPRKGKACLDVSYMGLIRLATDTGSIMWARAELVHENDTFIYKGATEKVEFKADNPFKRGEIIGVYCTAKTKEGDYLSGIMSIDEVHDIRNRSEAYKKNSGPWVTDPGEMIKKTIIKRESKTWPKSDKTERFDRAIEVVNEHEGIDFSKHRICGVPLDEFVPMDEIDEDKIQRLYADSVSLIEEEEPQPEAFRAIQAQVNQYEEIVLHKLLGGHKHGRKGYHTIFKEYANTYDEDVLPEHLAEP